MDIGHDFYWRLSGLGVIHFCCIMVFWGESIGVFFFCFLQILVQRLHTFYMHSGVKLPAGWIRDMYIDTVGLGYES